MKKFYAFALAMGLTATVCAQQLPTDGNWYYLVNAQQATYSNSEQRPNACFGIRTLNDKDVYAMQNFEADNEHLLWKFVADETNPDQYAMVNKAGEYVPVLGFIHNQNGTYSQDTRFEVKTLADGVIPESAYGFTLGNAGTIDADKLSHYDATIHGMQVGDTYFTICPNQTDDNGTVTDNTTLYLNAAGNGRQFAVNLWSSQGFPQSQFWIAVPQRQVEEAADVPEVGKYYRLVTGVNNDATYRNNKVFGTLELSGTNYYGLTAYADDPHQQWTFIPSEADPAVYAMVNKANEYVPMLGTIVSQNGTVNQDTRFEVKAVPADGLPADAYGFAITVSGAITEANLATYDATIHGMQVGDNYVMIRPLKYRRSRNNPTDDAYIVDNVAGNNPVDPENGNAQIPPFYLNAAGNARNLVVNLWHDEGNAPYKSEYWILVPMVEAPVAPAVPEVICSVAPSEGVVTIAKGGYADVTITAEEDAQVAYAFVEDATATPSFSIMNSNTAHLRIDRAGVLHYYAVRDEVSSEEATLTFTVDQSSGIAEIGSADSAAAAAVYDLQGRPVSALSKGIFIVNGKKVIIK